MLECEAAWPPEKGTRRCLANSLSFEERDKLADLGTWKQHKSNYHLLPGVRFRFGAAYFLPEELLHHHWGSSFISFATWGAKYGLHLFWLL